MPSKATGAQLQILIDVNGGRVERSTAPGDFGHLYIVDIDTGSRKQKRVSIPTTNALWCSGWITGCGQEDRGLKRERISLTPAGDAELGKHVNHDGS